MAWVILALNEEGNRAVPAAGDGRKPMSFAQPSLMPSFTRPASRVAIVRCERYDRDLSTLLFQALREFDLPVERQESALEAEFR